MAFAHRCLADRDSLPGEQVERPAVFDGPTSVGQLTVDEYPRTLLGLKPLILRNPVHLHPSV
jgi:hypothetical protein